MTEHQAQVPLESYQERTINLPRSYTSYAFTMPANILRHDSGPQTLDPAGDPA